MIIDHVEFIRNLVNEFSAFARFPDAHPTPCGLIPIIEETVALVSTRGTNRSLKRFIRRTSPCMNLDRQQIKQAMINLVDNAIAAIRAKGCYRDPSTHDPILKSRPP